MKKVEVALRHCYGIKRLDYTFDFSAGPAFAVYAPNGVMKSSFAKTFQDIADDVPSKDVIFSNRATTRHVVDEAGKDIESAEILVLLPYNDAFGTSERTSTLLVNNELRTEYAALFTRVEEARERLTNAIKRQSKMKRDVSEEISRTFSNAPGLFYRAINRVSQEISEQTDAPFANVDYEKIFFSR